MSVVEQSYDSNVSSYNVVKRSPVFRHFSEYSTIKYISPNVNYAGECLSGMKILDLGCGTGFPMSHMLEKGASEVVGVDISQGMIEDARKMLSQMSYQESRYSVHKADCFSSASVFEALPLETYQNYFDAITGVFLIVYAENMDQLNECFYICNKLLKNGGKLAFVSLNPVLITEFEFYEKLLSGAYVRPSNLREINETYVIDQSFVDPETGIINFTLQNRIFSLEQAHIATSLNGFAIKEAKRCEGNFSKMIEEKCPPLTVPADHITPYIIVAEKLHSI